MIVKDHTSQPSLAAERMRRHRQRRRNGLRCLMVQLRETEIDTLISRELLQTDARNDAQLVREALYKHLDRTLGTAS
jgi:SOS response regulatory protein OraA/RecX